MKISQLVSSKNKMPYHESIASRLPRGIKSQQQLLNLGYSVAVRDLGLLKAKTLDEGFASKLINSYHTQSLEEGVGSFLGKAAGNAVGAAGAAGRGLAGAWKDAKAGYAAAKGSWDPKSDKEEPAATGAAPTATATPAAGGTAPTATATPGPAGTTGGAAQGGTAGAGGISRPYVVSPDDAGAAPSAAGAAPAGGAAPSTAGNIGDIMKTIDALDRPSKEQLAGELEKSIAGGGKPAPAGMPPQGSPVGTPPAAPGATPPAAPGATPPAAPGATPPAAQGSTYDPAKAAADKLAKGQADQAAAGQQMAATQQANAASSQADNASVAQVKAIKDKQAAGQLVTSQELRTVKDAAAKGIREAEETKLKKKVVAEFHSKFLGRTI